jgi:hypothetical protein
MKKLGILIVGAAAVAAMLLSAGAASAKDRNHDQIPDKWEKKFHLSLKVDQANKDQDRDKVDNLNEFQEGTNPRDRDSDDDGVADGKEDRDHDGLNNKNEDMTANLPDDKDTDNDGAKDDDENAGVIHSFDGTTLVIDLAGGGQVSGLVTQNTEIECENENEIENEMEDLNDDSAKTSSDNSGPGSENSGPGSVNSGPGNDEGMDDEDEDDVCTTADLTQGTVVHEAEFLEGSNVFREVELVK